MRVLGPSAAAAELEVLELPPLKGREWRVIGGNSTGGIKVRTGSGLSSRECRARLATGSVVEELELVDERLHYRRIEGNGPDYGWVSIAARGRALVRPREEGDDEDSPPSQGEAELDDGVACLGAVDNPCVSYRPDDGLLLRFFDWQKGAQAPWDCSDSLSLIERLSATPSDVYSVAASWNDWSLEEMVQDRSMEFYHYLDLRLPADGGFFQIVLNSDWKQVLHPSSRRASSEAGDVVGPDGDGDGLWWALEGAIGDVFRVELQRSRGSASAAVTWKRLRREPPLQGEPPALMRARYYIVGSWTDWAQKQLMRWTGACYEFSVCIGATGSESFQLLEDANWKRRLHPDVRHANPHEPHALVGPSAEKATGLNWTIGRHARDEAAPDARYIVRLYVDAGGLDRVSWERQVGLDGESAKAHLSEEFWVVGREAGRDRKDIPVFTTLPGRLRLPLALASTRTVDLQRIPGAFALEGVMEPDECARLVELSERMGFSLDSSMAAGQGVRESETCTLLADSLLNDGLFERCRLFLPPVVDGGKLAGLNRRWRLYRYPAFGCFRPHVDGSWPGSGLDGSGNLVADAWKDRWSQLSCLVYLNDDFRGGCTRFFLPVARAEAGGPRPYRVEEVRPKCGSALFFFHGEHPMSPVHEGARIASGTKYVLRTDVLYTLPADRQSGQDFWRERFAGVSMGF